MSNCQTAELAIQTPTALSANVILMDSKFFLIPVQFGSNKNIECVHYIGGVEKQNHRMCKTKLTEIL